jgi:DNA (cytosine-5)-methyltransferase 1
MGKSKEINFVDLFCGCGGLSVGMELAGLNCVLGVDFDKDAIASFKENHPNSNAFHGDISNLTTKRLKELTEGKKIDVVVGGPPCQGFSTVGKGQAGDDRNFLFREFVRIVKVLNPKVVLFENVTGMLAKKNELVVKRVFKEFEKLGYHMDARVLSADEYGVPETRRRTILVGSKSGAPIFPVITHGDRGALKTATVKEAFRDLKAEDGKLYNHDPSTAQVKNELDRKRLAHIPEGKGVRYQRDEESYLPKRLRYDVDWETISENRFRQMKLQRLDRSKPSPTILTSRTSYYHPVEDRYLTVREAAAIQSFPNSFKFSGSLTSQFKQIGNAVPPLLAFALSSSIREMVNGKKATSQKNVDYKRNAFHYNNRTAL